jgi:ribose/xylose/arabinose/galactoside ABC-type transport system permease subunit
MSVSGKPEGGSVVQEMNPPSGPSVRTEQLMRAAPVVLLVLVLVILSLFVPYFLTTRNIINILLQSSALGLMALGMTVVLIVGGIDLSMPAVMAFSSILGVMYMREKGNPIVAGLIIIVVAMAIGSVNGYAVARLRMIPFVVTLSMQAIVMGASLWVTQAISVTGINEGFVDTVLAKVWIIPLPIIVTLLMAIIAQVIMRRTVAGRWLYATGTNIRAARVSGVPTTWVVFSAYVIAGFMTGLAAIILSSRLGSASASMGREGVVLDIIGAAVLGGASIYGGVGTAFGAIIGAILITLMSNSMNMMHVSYYMTLFLKGIIIIAVVALDSLRRQ